MPESHTLLDAFDGGILMVYSEQLYAVHNADCIKEHLTVIFVEFLPIHMDFFFFFMIIISLLFLCSYEMFC